jgi:hypothetical protein
MMMMANSQEMRRVKKAEYFTHNNYYYKTFF